MPLHLPPAPTPALRCVLAALGSPTAVREAPVSALRAHQGPLSPDHPLPVHVWEDVSRTGGTPRTRLAGWRFLVRGGERAVATAEAVLTADGWTFARFCGGPYVAATEQALAQAESLATPYQPRLLSVPELYMLTLWLHHDTASDGTEGPAAPGDLLVPLAPAPPGIAAHRPQRIADLLPRLTLRLTPATPLLAEPA
ncbi:hypothetical protein SAMN05428945_4532 [Streptomyces sp. 2224.1]|uniref:hypothetical protein n=1 Tax=unclassified Streptomyces TaxID=2593676 RepID=UPI00087FBAA8|nr:MULTISPECIES: hypothetical protein [unclassified Streptomyces]PBC80955.1 hypothetical protein BX261_0807 [Streptomyces sp. 2321.6]SDR56851.1 hypothetical protein SAMN05216511_6412 [Streptomyces sp. KS_16]SEB95329.1 hypothetical protein SAMN05428940_0806 [Streptomyces sp. 2133.1]SED31508.1 hypothetical protein SAMN05428945_4532 [Streptomyces sp. 2224.1]SEF11673.1 hypothetical protein SAMN05428954_6469 [Streptomyces sp. 2112.3]